MKTNEEKARLLAAFAIILSCLAFVLYNWKNIRGETHPNVSSWFVWSFMTILNFTSYKKLTGDWIKSTLPTVESGLCIATALMALHTGSFQNLSLADYECLMIGLIAALIWYLFKSAGSAQILLQIALVIGFIPTGIGMMENPSNEPWLPWCLWTVVFSAQCGVVKLTWRGRWIDFLYPVNAMFWHGLVFVLALM